MLRRRLLLLSLLVMQYKGGKFKIFNLICFLHFLFVEIRRKLIFLSDSIFKGHEYFNKFAFFNFIKLLKLVNLISSCVENANFYFPTLPTVGMNRRDTCRHF